MTFKHLVFAATSTVILATTFPSMPLGQNADAQAQYQSQSTMINISSDELKSSYWLSIYSSNNVQIKGEVKLDGRVIQPLNSSSTMINLSPYLNRGQHQVRIRGNYAPVNSLVTVELSGENNEITQQTGGSGLLNQVLIIQVQ